MAKSKNSPTRKYTSRKPKGSLKTQISISLPQELVDRIDAVAQQENRNRSNFIATKLEEIAGS